MKYLAFTLALAAAPVFAQPVNQGERDFALSSLHASRKAFLDSISGLSAAQWKFKPAPDRWSIAEVAEHVILSEDSMFAGTQKMFQTPAVADRGPARDSDQLILKRMADRTKKYKAGPEGQPAGRYANPAAAAAAFKERRDRTLDYIRTTQDALRAHVSGSGPNAMDAYQMFIAIAGHTDRHVAQINEVKSDPKYPKN